MEALINVEVMAQRRRIRVEYELPMKDQYEAFVRSIANAGS